MRCKTIPILIAVTLLSQFATAEPQNEKQEASLAAITDKDQDAITESTKEKSSFVPTATTTSRAIIQPLPQLPPSPPHPPRPPQPPLPPKAPHPPLPPLPPNAPETPLPPLPEDPPTPIDELDAPDLPPIPPQPPAPPKVQIPEAVHAACQGKANDSVIELRPQPGEYYKGKCETQQGKAFFHPLEIRIRH